MKRIFYSAVMFLLLSGTAMCQDTTKQVYRGTYGSSSDRHDVYTYAEQMPRFKGGEDSLSKYFATHLNYPKEARELNITGTVYVKFVVNADGAVSNPEIVKGIGNGCDEEALIVIASMPNWIPGMQNHKNVAVFMTLPVKYKMQ